MRKLTCVASFLSLLAAGFAQAAPAALTCKAPLPNPIWAERWMWNPKTNKVYEEGASKEKTPQEPKGPDAGLSNCFSDEVFVLSGDEMVPGAGGTPVPLVSCAAVGDCYLLDAKSYLTGAGAQAAATRAWELIKGKGGAADYDEIVVFTADFGPKTATGPLFYRMQNGMAGVNKVENLGIGPKVELDPNKPFVGVIDAGSTGTIGATPWTGSFSPCGSAPRRPFDAPSSQAAGALCAPGIYSYFDALAQATAAIFGPHLQVDADLNKKLGGNVVTAPQIKSSLVAVEMNVPKAKATLTGLSVDTWNAFLDTQGSLLGGNSFRDNGNVTFDVSRPPAFQGVSAPYEGTTVLRFQPMDLYILGFMAADEVPQIKSFMKLTPANIYVPQTTSFGAAVGPNMGTRVSGVSLFASANAPAAISFQEIVNSAANGGERKPSYKDGAPQHIRQLWVLVRKPESVIKAAVDKAVADQKDEEKKEESRLDEAVKQYKPQHQAVLNLHKARRTWSEYFYTMAQYRGRVVTTSEGNVDDNAYFEFGDANDDPKNFSGEGLELAFPGYAAIPNGGGKATTALTVNTDGNGQIVYKADGPGLRIAWDAEYESIEKETDDKGTEYDVKKGGTAAPSNIVTIRMKLPRDDNRLKQMRDKLEKWRKDKKKAEPQLYATFTLTGPGGDIEFRLPGNDEAYLIPDGKFRNYSANLASRDEFKKAGATWNGFTFSPSNQPFECRVEDPSGCVQIEFIKITNVASSGDTDKDCADKAKPDGWMDAEDNCPKLFNPDQADGNGDGIGDACEDYDGDNKLNFCDNCPTLTNSGQRDKDKDGTGDICDDEKDTGCIWLQSTVAGPAAPTSAFVKAAAMVLGFLGVVLVLRRRRRR